MGGLQEVLDEKVARGLVLVAKGLGNADVPVALPNGLELLFFALVERRKKLVDLVLPVGVLGLGDLKALINVLVILF